uniref:Protein MIS12 homolog n=1 Tax=Leersia perrieri TaxID=77586 RepID=A0A0D9VIE7_9ORYZ
MEEGNESAAAAAAAAEAEEAALGLNVPLFVDSILYMVDDLRHGAFEYCVQLGSGIPPPIHRIRFPNFPPFLAARLFWEGAPQAIGAATATQKAEELERGVIGILNLVKDVLDTRMSNWEKYCFRHCFAIPEGFLMREDENSSAKEVLIDGNSDSDLDAELDSLRKKLEDANNESEELQREISSLERQTECQRNLDSSMAELLKLFESKSFQGNFEDLVKAIPLFHQKIKGMKRKITGSTLDKNVWHLNGLGDHKRLASGFSAGNEDIQELVNVLKMYPGQKENVLQM